MQTYRKPRIAYPNALPGTCKHCGHPTHNRRSRSHKTCRDKYSEEVSYREAAQRREGKYQRCVDCKRVEGELVTIDGRPVRVKITRDHVVPLARFGSHKWTVPRCVQCHQKKSAEDNRVTKQWRDRGSRAPRPVRNRRQMDTTKRRSGGSKPSSSWKMTAARLMAGTALVSAAVLNLTGVVTVDDVQAAAPTVIRWAVALGLSAAALIVVMLLHRWRARHRADQVYRITALLAEKMRCDPTQVKLKVKRWTAHQMPVRGRMTYATGFDDEDQAERAKVEALLQRKIGYRLDVTWWPHRDTLEWRPAADQTPLPQDDPSPVQGPEVADQVAEDEIVTRLTTGIEAVLGKGVSTAVTAWHTTPDDTAPLGVRRGQPQSILFTYPPSAKVHDDKVVDDVEDKVTSLLPGRWRAEWNTKADQVVFTDTPDPLAETVTGIPLADGAPVDKLAIGRLENGALWQIMLEQTPHLLIAGASGAGKGSILWSIVRALMPGILAGTAMVWGIDPKGIELARGRKIFRKYAVSVEASIKMLEDAVEFMEVRKQQLAAKGLRMHKATPGDPVLYILIDEIAALTLYGVDKKTRDKVIGLLGLLITQGRALGVCLVGALQDPRKDVIKIRDLFPGRIALRLAEATHCDLVLGPGSRAAGARADKIPADMAGVSYMVVDGKPLPSRARACWVDDPEISRMEAAVAAALADGSIPMNVMPSSRRTTATTNQLPARGPRRRRTSRHRPLWNLVSIDDLRDGDVIILELDGVVTEVEMEGRPVESPDDDQRVEIAWKGIGGRKGVASIEASAMVERRPT